MITIFILTSLYDDLDGNQECFRDMEFPEVKDFACFPGNAYSNLERAQLAAQQEFEREWQEIVVEDHDDNYPGVPAPACPPLVWEYRSETHMHEAEYADRMNAYFRITELPLHD